MRLSCTKCAKSLSAKGINGPLAGQHSPKRARGQNKIGPFRRGSERAAGCWPVVCPYGLVGESAGAAGSISSRDCSR